MFGRKKRGGTSKPLVQTVPKNKQQVGFLGAAATEYQSRAERALYESMREAVPIICSQTAPRSVLTALPTAILTAC